MSTPTGTPTGRIPALVSPVQTRNASRGEAPAGVDLGRLGH